MPAPELPTLLLQPQTVRSKLILRQNLIDGVLARTRDAITALKEGNTGQVVVGAGSSMRLELVPEACVRLRRRRLDVRIKLIGELYPAAPPCGDREDRKHQLPNEGPDPRPVRRATPTSETTETPDSNAD